MESPEERRNLGGPQLTQDEYKKKARDEYKNLLQKFEFRCFRAELMNYRVSSDHDNMSQWWQYLALPLGTGVVSALPTSFFAQDGLSWSTWILIFFGNITVNLLAKGGMEIYKSKNRRANSHTEAGAGWQKLKQTAQSYLVQLENPELDPKTMSEWYEGLLEEREKICKLAVVPEASYKTYTTEMVYKEFKRRGQMHQQYKDMISANERVEDDETDVESDREKAYHSIAFVFIIIILLIKYISYIINFCC